ncbi:MAG: hypothetical protein EA408_09390 [Marinilabiliales bacterium]|nr:MAG: hypothetical protein EA408_09390 [Marinilabiliales bacterium]
MQDILSYSAIIYAVTYTIYHTALTFLPDRLKGGMGAISGGTGKFTAGTDVISGNKRGPAAGKGSFTAGPGTLSGKTGKFTAGYCASCSGCAFSKK